MGHIKIADTVESCMFVGANCRGKGEPRVFIFEKLHIPLKSFEE